MPRAPDCLAPTLALNTQTATHVMFIVVSMHVLHMNWNNDMDFEWGFFVKVILGIQVFWVET